MSSVYLLRDATPADGAFLGDMVLEAANWSERGARPRHVVLESVEYSRYLTGWMRPGDRGVVAHDEHGADVGAAWFRMLPRDAPGFGYVAAGVPELIIGVRPMWRAHGVGRSLLRAIVERACAEGHGRVSLSVERGNFARTLYRSEGFAVTNSGHGREIMVKTLN